MSDASRAADKVMESASKDIIGMLKDEALDKMEKDKEETEEKIEEARGERKEEKEELIEKDKGSGAARGNPKKYDCSGQ